MKNFRLYYFISFHKILYQNRLINMKSNWIPHSMYTITLSVFMLPTLLYFIYWRKYYWCYIIVPVSNIVITILDFSLYCNSENSESASNIILYFGCTNIIFTDAVYQNAFIQIPFQLKFYI